MTKEALKTMTELESALRWLELNNVTVSISEGHYYINEYFYEHGIEAEGGNLIEVAENFQKQLLETCDMMITELTKAFEKALTPVK